MQRLYCTCVKCVYQLYRTYDPKKERTQRKTYGHDVKNLYCE